MNELQIIGTRPVLNRMVRVYGTYESPLFLAKDVAEWIEHSNVSAMVQSVDEDEKDLVEGETLDYKDCLESGNLRTKRIFLTENGLYEVLFQSRKPIAKEFKREVKKLLHDLRTGQATITMSPDMLIAKALIAANDMLQQKERLLAEKTAKIEQDAPKVLFADAVSCSQTDILVGEFAKLLRQNGVDVGQNRFFEWLRRDGYLCRQNGAMWNSPTQRAKDLQIFRTKETVITHSDGHTTISLTHKITGKGQQYLLAKYLPTNSLIPAWQAETDAAEIVQRQLAAEGGAV
ncbi:antirepressor [Planctomycetales bacterium]|nr:antirepressor [Planctomycetales bacterium]